MFYGNGGGMVGVNPRKRVREAMNTIAFTPVNLFHLQSQPSASTLINLAQLHNHHSPMVSTGLKLKLWIEMNRQTLDRDRDRDGDANVVYAFVPLPLSVKMQMLQLAGDESSGEERSVQE